MATKTDQSGSAVMTGEQTAKNYLRVQKFIGKAYLKKFYQIVAAKNKTGRFLEIGSGPGYQTVEVMKEFHPREIVVVEPSTDMVNTATRYIQQWGLGNSISFNTGVVENTELIQNFGKFALIYSTLSLHHWTDPVGAFSNLYQALEPDGVIIIHDFQRIEMPFHLTLHNRTGKPGHTPYTADEITCFLEKAGINQYELVPCFPFQIIVITRSGSEKKVGVNNKTDKLDELYPGQEAAIVAIHTDEERKRELATIGVHMSAHIKIIESDIHHVVLGIDQRKIVMDRETASGIAVQVF